MGLAETQHLLARLYTETNLRECFFADPNAVGAQCGLSHADIQTLAQVPQDQITFFVRSLQNKRLGEVRKLLPLTCRVLGSHAVPLFEQYADTPILAGLRKHRQDALAFAAFLKRTLPELADLPPWLPDLLRYEAGWLTVGSPGCRWHSMRSQHAILPLVRSLRSDEAPLVTRCPTLALWWRPTRNGQIRHHVSALGLWKGNIDLCRKS